MDQPPSSPVVESNESPGEISPQRTFSRKEIILIGGIVSFFAIGIVIVLFILSKHKAVQPVSNGQAVVSSRPSPQSGAWQTETTEYFSADYPKDWVVTPTSHTPQLVEYTMNPKGMSYPVIKIAVLMHVSDKLLSLSKESYAHELKYVQVNLSGGMLFSSYQEGTIPGLRKPTNDVNTKVQEKVAFATSNQKTYRISYQYLGNKNNDADERFLKVIRSITAR